MCETCRAGYYCATAGTTLAVYEATPCIGNVCELNAFHYDSETCPKGYYCPSGAFQKIPCPRGTYNDLTGKTLLADCLATPAGKFTDTEGSTLTDVNL